MFIKPQIHLNSVSLFMKHFTAYAGKGLVTECSKMNWEVELVIYTGIPVLLVCLTDDMVYQYGCPYWYAQLLPESTSKVLKFPEGKENFSSTWRTHMK